MPRVGPQADFAKRFTQWREAQGTSRRALAARLGVTEQTLRNWEQGGVPSFMALRELVRVSGLSADWWLGIIGHRRRP